MAKTKLGSRERSLLETLAFLNDQGETPSMRGLIRQDAGGVIPSRTQAYRYEIVHRLAKRGLIDHWRGSISFQLRITDEGRKALEEAHDEKA